MSDDIQRADQIAFHFYTKLFYTIHDARATEGARPQAKTDKWFNLETPDCDLFTREAREPYRNISLAPGGPAPLEIEVLLSIPELASNKVLVYAPPDSARVRIDPARRFILLETWRLSAELYRGGRTDAGADVALPTIYKHGIVLFRSLYSLLRVLPVWKFYKRLRRRVGGVNRNGNLGIQLRVCPQGAPPDSSEVLRFGVPLAPSHMPLSTQSHVFASIPHLLGTFSLRSEYLAAPHFFQIDEREALLSSGFLSSDRDADVHTDFVPTLERHRQRDSISGSNLTSNAPVASSPPRAVGLGRASSTGSTTTNATGARNSSNVAERFLIPSRVASVGIGPSANTGSTALIPPPRPFPTISGGNPTSTSSTTGSNTNIHANPAGFGTHLRRESLTSSTSSSISARDPLGYTKTTPSPSTIPLPNPGHAAGTSSLSSSPSGGVPIRRPGINPAHPFKSNTLSSAGGSSPSMSIRQGVAGSPAGMGVGIPSSLGREVAVGQTGNSHSRHASFSSSGMQNSPVIPGARLPPLLATNITTGTSSGSTTGEAWPSPPGHATTFAPSSLGSDRPRFTSITGRGMSVERESGNERDANRRRSMQGPFTGIVASESGSGGGGGQPVPVPMAPRRRFESSFGHRHKHTGSGGGSVGSGMSGGGTAGSPSLGAGVGGVRAGSTPGSVQGSAAGSVPSGQVTPASSREASNTLGPPHDFEEDKEISIFVQDIDDRKPLSGRMKERESSTRRDNEHQQHIRDTTDTTIKGKERAHLPTDVTSPYISFPVEVPSPSTSAGDIHNSARTTAATSPSEATSPPAYLSTSPQRGPMLTSEDEITDRLRLMNENFLRSLEGIDEGSIRRKKAKDPRVSSPTTKSGAGDESPILTVATEVDRYRSGSLRSAPAATATTSSFARPTPPTSPLATRPLEQLNITPGARLEPERSATRETSTESDRQAYRPGLGLGLPARVRRASGSSSTFETTASQGSEEVIGRMDFDGERRRWAYGFPPP